MTTSSPSSPSSSPASSSSVDKNSSSSSPFPSKTSTPISSHSSTSTVTTPITETNNTNNEQNERSSSSSSSSSSPLVHSSNESLPPPSTPIKKTPRKESYYSSTPIATPARSLPPMTPSRRPSLLDPNQYLPMAQAMLEEERKGPIQRLVITTMILENFKSYAGVQKIGPFHKSFTAVVGANGSGKSNIIDALLFVFGYRANKLRQSKLGHLIHLSDKYPDLPQCTVTIHFQEILEYPDNKLPQSIVPNSEFSISRTAYRNHSSKYFINQESKPFSEVVTLLNSKHVDLNNHRFLILQGEVESIAQMKAKAPTEHEDGLLEYLEDIIGTRHYKTPIEEGVLELEQWNEKRNEKLARAVFIEQEKKRLEGAKTKAEAFLDLEKQCAQHQAWLLHTRLKKEQLTSKECEEALELVENELMQLETSSQTMTTECSDLETELKKIQKEYQASQVQVQKLEKEVMAMTNEDVKLRELKKGVKRKIEKVRKSIEKHKFTIAEQERWLHNDVQDTDKINSELIQLQTQHETNVQTLEKMNLELRFKTHDLQVQLDQLKTGALPLTTQFNQKSGEMEVTQSEIEALIEFKQRHQHSCAQLKEKIQAQGKQLQTYQSQLTEWNEQKQKLLQQRQSLDLQLQENQQQQVEAKNEMHEVRIKLEEQKLKVQSQRSSNQVLDALLKLKKQVPGIYDRLGHLGTIPPEYDIAVSTAFPGLDYIVVDSVATGQQCLEYLRQHQLGRVNLICLDKLASFPMQSIQTPEQVVRLFDQVQFKHDRFKPAFYHVMRDTLVAKDLEQANRIAFTPQKRWRVVTLDGQLIDTSGTMSGGGHHVFRGKMMLHSATSIPSSFKEQEDEDSSHLLSSLELSQNRLSSTLRELTETQRRLDSQMQSWTQQFTHLEQDMAMDQLQLEQLQLKQQQDETTLSELETQSPKENHETEQTLSVLNKKLKKLKHQVDQLQVQVKEKEALIDAKQDEIDDVGGMEYKVLKYQVQTDASEIEKLNHRLAKSKVHKKQAEKQKEQSEHQLKESEEELIHLEKEMESAETQLHNDKDQLKVVSDRLKQAKRELDNQEDQMQSLQQQMEAHSEQMLKYKKQKAKWIRTKEQKLQELQDAQHHVTQLQQRWDQLEDTLKNEEQNLLLCETSMLNVQDVQTKLHQLKHELQQMSGEVQLSVLEEYAQRDREHQQRLEELDQVTQTRDQVKQKCEELKKQRLKEFMTGFALISQKLKEMYQLITCGGNAELELVDSMDPFSEGISFSVMPPKKSWKQIQHLSGGEKTLASLALVFALHHYKPTPLYVMDEIDAALDFRNVSIIAHYIKEQTQTAQFIIISLRHNMFELSNRLVGIYKTEQCTKSITVNPHAFQICEVPTPSS